MIFKIIESLDRTFVDEQVTEKQALWSQATAPFQSIVPVVGVSWGEVKSLDRDVKIRVFEDVGGARHPFRAGTARSDGEVRERFVELHEEWSSRTMFSSALDDLIYDEAFQRILAMGPQVIPLALDQLHSEPIPWFYALKMLADEDPAEGISDPDEAIERWLSWGRANGILP